MSILISSTLIQAPLRVKLLKSAILNCCLVFLSLRLTKVELEYSHWDLLENVSLTIQNTLLKTIEEPPKNLKVVLYTKSTRSVPLTIKSRCQIIDLRKDIETEIDASMKKFSELDKKLVPLLFKGENIIVSDAAKACLNYEIEDILDRVILWVHDALLVAANQCPLFFKSYKDEYLKAIKKVENLQCLIETNHNILEMKRYLFNNLNKNLFLENIFMEFKNGFK